MKKRILSVFLLMTMTVAVIACGKENKETGYTPTIYKTSSEEVYATSEEIFELNETEEKNEKTEEEIEIVTSNFKTFTFDDYQLDGQMCINDCFLDYSFKNTGSERSFRVGYADNFMDIYELSKKTYIRATSFDSERNAKDIWRQSDYPIEDVHAFLFNNVNAASAEQFINKAEYFEVKNVDDIEYYIFKYSEELESEIPDIINGFVSYKKTIDYFYYWNEQNKMIDQLDMKVTYDFELLSGDYTDYGFEEKPHTDFSFKISSCDNIGFDHEGIEIEEMEEVTKEGFISVMSDNLWTILDDYSLLNNNSKKDTNIEFSLEKSSKDSEEILER